MFTINNSNVEFQYESGAGDPILRDSKLPESPYLINLIDDPAELKTYVLENAGAGVRYSANGVVNNVYPWEVQYINYARYGNETGTPESRYSREFIAETSRTLTQFERDHGFLQDWATTHGLSMSNNVHNEIKENWNGINGNYKVINKAGYTNLEIYLAEIAGDFHMLAGSVTLAVEDLEIVDVTIYPIPTKDKKLNISNIKGVELTLTIYDTTGREVHKEKLIESTNTIDLNNLSKGLYFLKIANNSNVLIKNIKFILN